MNLCWQLPRPVGQRRWADVCFNSFTLGTASTNTGSSIILLIYVKHVLYSVPVFCQWRKNSPGTVKRKRRKKTVALIMKSSTHKAPQKVSKDWNFKSHINPIIIIIYEIVKLKKRKKKRCFFSFLTVADELKLAQQFWETTPGCFHRAGLKVNNLLAALNVWLLLVLDIAWRYKNIYFKCKPAFGLLTRVPRRKKENKSHK